MKCTVCGEPAVQNGFCNTCLQDGAFLESEGSKISQAVIKEIAMHAETLKSLEAKMVDCEASFKAAKKQYDDFRTLTLPTIMRTSGVTFLGLETGGTIQVQEKHFCSPNKNDADKKIISDWLKANKGDNLVKEHATVDKEFIQALKDQGIPFAEKSEVNTNSLKAWLISQMGLNGGPEIIKREDIPECVHFFSQDECVVKA